MAITFIQQKRRQRYMILILAGVVFLALIFLWQVILKPKPIYAPATSSPLISKMSKKIEINLDIFKNSAFQALESFEEIAFPKEKIGRENPFTPY